jgi:hypothetical protein
MNELNIPIGGVGPEGAFDVTCLGQVFTIRYVVNMRSGATHDMVINTIKHFKHAVQILAAGHKEPSAAVGERDVYNDKLEHGESRSNVWTFRSFAVVPNPKGNRIFKVPINLCNEFTSAATLINWVLFAVEIMNNDTLADDFIHAGSIIEPNTQAKPQSKLDEYFPRDENNKPITPEEGKRYNYPQQPQPQQQTLPPATDGNSPYLGSYNHKQKQEYIKAYAGTTVKIDVRKMERVFGQQSGLPEVQVYTSYNGNVSKYPTYDLKVKQNRLEKVDEDTRAILESVLKAPPESRGTNTTAYIGTYFMFVPENDPSKMYPLLTKLEAVPQAAAQGGDAKDEVMGQHHPADEIPF